jgi:predicted transposase YbfD/YdcC
MCRADFSPVLSNAKSSEITAVPKLLKMLCLKGTIVTVDALNCQRKITQQIVEQGGDYALALKGNQGTLHADARTFLDDPKAEATTTNTTVDGDHGRIETRIAIGISRLKVS